MPIRPPFDLRAKFRAVSRSFRATFDADSVGGVHTYEKGMRRENILREFLADHLPRRYGAARGEIVDSRGWTSRQLDVVIYDALFCPLLQESEASRIFPAEAAYAAIEFKPRLALAELERVALAITSAKRLDRSALVPQHEGRRMPRRPSANPAPFTAIFALKADCTPRRLAFALSAIHQKKVPDAWLDCICILDSALIYHFQGDETPDGTLHWSPAIINEETFVGYYPSGQDTLLLFYLFLLRQLTVRSLFPADLLRYTEQFTASLQPNIVGPNLHVPPEFDPQEP